MQLRVGARLNIYLRGRFSLLTVKLGLLQTRRCIQSFHKDSTEMANIFFQVVKYAVLRMRLSFLNGIFFGKVIRCSTLRF